MFESIYKQCIKFIQNIWLYSMLVFLKRHFTMAQKCSHFIIDKLHSAKIMVQKCGTYDEGNKNIVQ